MQRLREHPVVATGVSFAIAALAVMAIAAASGFGAFADAWRNLHPAWILLAIAGTALSLPAYALAYRCMAAIGDGPRLRPPLVARLVIAGFGAFAPAGGFWVDKRALHAIEDDGRTATARVLGLTYEPTSN